jgi:hypothetical protein
LRHATRAEWSYGQAEDHHLAPLCGIGIYTSGAGCKFSVCKRLNYRLWSVVSRSGITNWFGLTCVAHPHWSRVWPVCPTRV